MSGFEGVPCLLFLADEDADSPEDEAYASEDQEIPTTPLTEPMVKGYALLPTAFKKEHPEVLEDFSNNHIRVLSKDQAESSLPLLIKKYPLMLFEAKLSRLETGATGSSSTSVRVLVGVFDRCDSYEAPDWLWSTYGDFLTPSYFYRTRISDAIEEESLTIIEELLRRGANIVYGHHKGGTFLHFAVKRRQRDLVELLIRNGANVEAERYDWDEELIDRNSWTRPLFIAAKKGYPEILKVLLDHGAAYDSKTYTTFMTPIRIAFTNRHPEALRLLLQAEAKSNYDICFRRTIPYYLREAAKDHLLDLSDVLLSFSPDLSDEFNKVTYHMAFLHQEKGVGQLRCCKQMEDYGFKMNFDEVGSSDLVLFGAIMNNWLEVVRKLVKVGADVNKVSDVSHFVLLPWPTDTTGPLLTVLRHRYFTPLHMAAAFAGEAVIKLLLDHGAHVNAKLERRTPIYVACQAHNFSAVKLLITSGADVRHNPELMCLAVEGGHPESVELLLLNRTPSSLEDGELTRLLARAVAKQNLKVMNVLFKFGAQPNAGFTVECKRAFEESREGGHLETLQTLFDHSFSSVDFIQEVTTVIRFLDRKGAAVFPVDCSSCHKDITACFILLVRHIVKLESAGLSFLHQNLAPFGHSTEGLRKFRSKCETEVVRLRSETVGNSSVTFYDILTKNDNRLASYAKHKDFIKIMRTGDYKRSFPIYGSILSCQFQKGSHRRRLLNRGVEVCSKLNEAFKLLPDLVKEEIIKYLPNYNLELLSYEHDNLANKKSGN